MQLECFAVLTLKDHSKAQKITPKIAFARDLELYVNCRSALLAVTGGQCIWNLSIRIVMLFFQIIGISMKM